MFRSILVPLDGSRFAEAAIPTAAGLARLAQGHLHLLTAHTPAAAVVGMGELPVIPTELDADLKQRELAYLSETAVRLGMVGGAPVESRQVVGAAGTAVCEEATRLGADLVVMATHGRGALGRVWLGSVADHVVRHLPVPVLLIRPGHADPAPSPDLSGEILVALDLSRHSEAVLVPVAEIARLTRGHITLFHVVEPYYTTEPGALYPMLQDPTVTEVRRADAESQLEQIAERLRAQGLGVSVWVVVGKNAASSLITALEGRTFGLVAMTALGAGGLRRLLLGSVADKVIRASSQPVLVLRPPATAG